jgi:hypothetical protein
MRTWVLDNVILVSLIVIALMIVVAIILLRYSYRVSLEKSPKSQIATFGVQLLMTVLVGLWLNNLYASARERDQRLWALRQEHLVRLRPVLRADAERLSEVARRIRVEGRVTDINKDRAEQSVELRSLFSPDLLSGDIPNHYPEYSQAKDRLRRGAEEQDKEFHAISLLVMKGLSLPRVAEARRVEVARSFLEKCLEKGPGMTLTVGPNGYQYTSRGSSHGVGGSSIVAEDERAAFRAFSLFQPDSEVTAHCESLKTRAASIFESAKNLAAEALVLAERTTLSGSCEYTRLD